VESREESASEDRPRYEGFGGLSAVLSTLESWKIYRRLISEEYGRTVKSLTLDK